MVLHLQRVLELKGKISVQQQNLNEKLRKIEELKKQLRSSK